MLIANYQGVFDLTALVSIRVNIKHAHKQSFQSNVKNRTRPLKWMLFCFCFCFLTIFLKARKKKFDTEMSEDLLFFTLILRTRIKDGYHVPKI